MEVSTKKHPILIVEDSFDDFYTVKRGLKRAGLANDFIHCETGEQALDYLSRRGQYAGDENLVTPHMILLDLNMPGLGGLQTLEIIKSDVSLKNIPVIVLTTSDDPNDIEKCYASGANSYMQKPVNLESFVQALQRLKDYWFEVVVLPGSR